MALANLGSIATNVLLRVENVPASISGNILEIVNEERLDLEQWHGQAIGSVDIAEKYQPALTAAAMAGVAEAMITQGVDATKVKLGEFMIDKGNTSSIVTAAKGYRMNAERKRRPLGRAVRFRRVLG